MLISGIGIGRILPFTPDEKVEATGTDLPENITSEGVKFFYNEKGIQCQFVPSVGGSQYEYKLTFKDSQEQGITVEAVYENGICYGTVSLEKFRSYEVVAIISDGTKEVPFLVAQDLKSRCWQK